MNNNLDEKINEYLDWLDSEAEFFIQNPQVNQTYTDCSKKLKEILSISHIRFTDKNRIECPYSTCNLPAGHKSRCNQFDGR